VLSPPLVTSGTAPRRIAMVLAFAVALACTPEQTVAPSPTPSPEPSPPPFLSLVDAGTRATYKGDLPDDRIGAGPAGPRELGDL
jgi:hypothetical protein